MQNIIEIYWWNCELIIKNIEHVMNQFKFEKHDKFDRIAEHYRWELGNFFINFEIIENQWQ